MSPQPTGREKLEMLEIRSEEMQEIMGYIPRWIVRWGITAISSLVLLLLIGSWFFKYPDVLVSTIVVVSNNPPTTVVSQADGKIRPLLVVDNQLLNQGDPLAVIDNPANYHDVLRLKERLIEFRPFLGDPAALPSELFSGNLALGDLQQGYELFLKTRNDFRTFLSLDYHQKKIASIRLQIARQRELIEHQTKQYDLMREEAEIVRRSSQRLNALFAEGFVSQGDVERGRAELLQKEFGLEDAKTNLDNILLQVSGLEETIVDLQLQRLEQKNRWQTELKQTFDNLLSQIEQWEHRYLLKAPIAGRVTFTNYWSENQFVPAGAPVFAVVPTEPREIIGRLKLPIAGSGKVKVGHHVNIKFDNYPFMEYGIVRGRIRFISLLPSENLYMAEVELPEGLRTNYGRELPFFQQMQGSGEVITEEMRVLERIFQPLRAALKRK